MFFDYDEDLFLCDIGIYLKEVSVLALFLDSSLCRPTHCGVISMMILTRTVLRNISFDNNDYVFVITLLAFCTHLGQKLAFVR